jgi:phosphate starvation-inducible protein PhoH
VRNLFKHELAFGVGPAGTGKTYLAVAVAVNQMINGHVDKIILSRPAVEAGERLGFLPGDMKEKVDPYMQPLYDALHDFLPGKTAGQADRGKDDRDRAAGLHAGRTLSNAYVVLDEAQNATSMQMKMFLTRLGQGSRMVITGDRSQVDLPRGQPSGLIEAERILDGVGGISFNYFTSKDVVRHPMVAKVIEAYDADAAKGSVIASTSRRMVRGATSSSEASCRAVWRPRFCRSRRICNRRAARIVSPKHDRRCHIRPDKAGQGNVPANDMDPAARPTGIRFGPAPRRKANGK